MNPINHYPVGDALRERLTAQGRKVLEAADVPGASLALFLDGTPVLANSIGFSDLARTRPLDDNARFYIYSITKTLLATALLQMVERGRLVLDAPLESYLPGISLPEPVSIRQLLRHTAGIPDYGGLPAYASALRADPSHPWTEEEFLAATLPRGLAFKPGQGWGYSNIGYMLLRLLLERLSGQSLAALLKQNIFDPLALQHTFVAATLDDARALTPGYSESLSRDDTLQDVAPLYHPGWVSHGVVISTAPELAQIFEALFGSKLFSPELLAEMLDPVAVQVQHPLFRQPSYGLGLMIDPQSPYGIVAGHGGGGPGYSAAALHLPAVAGRRITCVTLFNSDRGEPGLNVAMMLARTLADSLTEGEA